MTAPLPHTIFCFAHIILTHSSSQITHSCAERCLRDLEDWLEYTHEHAKMSALHIQTGRLGMHYV